MNAKSKNINKKTGSKSPDSEGKKSSKATKGPRQNSTSGKRIVFVNKSGNTPKV